MRRALKVVAVSAGIALVSGHAVLAQSQGRGQGLGRAVADTRGRAAVVAAEMPPEMAARNGLDAVEALRGDLGQRVREHGGDPDRYAELLAADASLWIDGDGQLMFVDVVEHDATAAGGDTTASTETTSGPAPTPTGYLASGLPIHHSKPGAPWTIYLDLDGATVRSSLGGWQFGTSSRSTLGLSIDTDFATFNPEEQAVISRLWGRVAEDYAPFDVDVTTEPPAVIDSRVLWSIVGRHPSDFGFPSNVGGVSLFNLGYVPFGFTTPTLTFWGAWGAANHSDIADTISQEDGHMFGLLHDGVRTSTGGIIEYYAGHGTGPTSWAPIMGTGGRNVTQWSRGEYPDAINPLCFGSCSPYPAQDDIAIIAGKLGRRGDDHGDDIATATPLAVPATGVVATTTDIDVFALPRASDVRIEITPYRAGEQTDGGNLDVAADIVNTSGLVVASVDDVNETAAVLTAVLPTGQHYLRVRSSFNPDNYPIYDSLGQYTVTGTFTNAVRLTGFAEPLPAGYLEPGRTLPVKFTFTDAVAGARVQLWSHPAAGGATVLAETECRAQTGFRQHCDLKLPKTLTAGATYWIAAQYVDLDGQWVTAEIVPGTATPNPIAVVAQ